MTGSRRIDLNSDVGEGLESDAALIPLVTSVNVACGAHAGDEATMRRTVELALRHGVAIGAHPGYPDRASFGRLDLDLPDAELRASLRAQLAALRAVAEDAGATVAHVKPHGALYNRAAVDSALARSIAEVVREACGPVVLVGLAGSRLLEEGRAAGLPVAGEAFADRAYEPDGTLRPRSRPGAVHGDPEHVASQALAIARDGRVPLDGDGEVIVDADTICLHGDTPGAVANARAVREGLAAACIEVVAIGKPNAMSGVAAAAVGPPRIVPFGERAWLLELGDVVDEALNARVLAIAASIEERRARGLDAIERPVPAYASLLLAFDPRRIAPEAVRALLEEATSDIVVAPVSTDPRTAIEIAVRYGGTDGPDLDEVADRLGRTSESVVALHTGTTYRVFMLGFAPGFAYLGTLPEELSLPRRAEPRVSVPAGSVGIAARQTAVYPVTTPGGWHLIGRTDARLWDPTAVDSPALLAPGDRVRFVPA